MSIQTMMPLRTCLLAAWLCGAGIAVAQSLKVTEVRVEGRAVDRVVTITQFLPPQRTPVALQIRAGQVLEDGLEISVPARTVVTLQTANGNRIELAPDARFSSARINNTGEAHTLISGSARFDVQRALSFFNVDFNRFVALVRGTVFEVQAGRGGDGALQVQRGRVAVQREVPTVLQDTGLEMPMLEQVTLDAQGRSWQAWPAREAPRRYARSSQALQQYSADLQQYEQREDRYGRMAALNNLGLTLLARNRPQDAADYFQRMLGLAQGAQDERWRERARRNLRAVAATSPIR